MPKITSHLASAFSAVFPLRLGWPRGGLLLPPVCPFALPPASRGSSLHCWPPRWEPTQTHMKAGERGGRKKNTQQKLEEKDKKQMEKQILYVSSREKQKKICFAPFYFVSGCFAFYIFTNKQGGGRGARKKRGKKQTEKTGLSPFGLLSILGTSYDSTKCVVHFIPILLISIVRAVPNEVQHATSIITPTTIIGIL